MQAIADSTGRTAQARAFADAGKIPMASRSNCAASPRAAWLTSACTALTKATTFRRRWRDCSPGPRRAAWPTASGSATNGRILRSSRWRRCRYDVGLEVPDATLAEGEVSITTFPPFLVAEIEIAGTVELELRALDWLFRTWLPTSGYAPAHQTDVRGLERSSVRARDGALRNSRSAPDREGECPAVS